MPHARIAEPAIAWLNLPSRAPGNRFKPNDITHTIASIVAIVTAANVIATGMAAQIFICRTAGNINTGINGSHGPKTKIVNSIQGVMFFFAFES